MEEVCNGDIRTQRKVTIEVKHRFCSVDDEILTMRITEDVSYTFWYVAGRRSGSDDSSMEKL